jgi:hypothetical protein
MSKYFPKKTINMIQIKNHLQMQMQEEMEEVNSKC